MTLEWSDPPEARRKGKWRTIFVELEAKPGVWAKLHENTARNAYSLAGRLRKMAGPAFEFTSRSYGDGQAGVWGRYTGGTEEPQLVEVEIDGGTHEDMEPEELPDPL